MAGRGRGRSYSFDTGALGFGKGDAIPAAILQPPPLFPPLELKPSPLRNTEADEYLLALKQEFRAGMKDSQYFVKTSVKSKDIARYSDKYKTSQNNGADFRIDNALLPKELQKRLKRTKLKEAFTPSIVIKKKRPNNDKLNIDDEETTTLEVLEKVIEEKVVADDEDVQEGDEIEEEEEYYEEDEEEDNDYLVNHFDEGDDEFGMGDDDDGDEGPVY